MIIGHGIDLQNISAIENAYQRHHSFASRVLTKQEKEKFESLKGQRRMTYLAGRWAGKEALSKALGTGIGQLSFQDIEILNDDKGVPYFSKLNFDGKAHISISHSGDYVEASVILEDVR
ncbi:phosphopantetheine-protein transferase domain protein [Streptococcus urinalis FB127-CNA-2]|uniref:Holo-[acyl-carrier-protein] synthase n=1 Tax=Streptococcus urinalis 2285-97 TaxID=764291 RepID=G5KCX7_9STRE|nr:holo-ACP synthase [Streptococcus urinalis]EHJ56596.1 holo-[acyl-carrier-protein] synthase [Streptococcus urinalis 2285-97]EKS17102.1 phosphopantetheine-protein transferase domain protein [Streptococcus urinalis FB127-CNA-2]VEF32648.1 holo-[acyl-carrier-protein] synthase [Streptococcus urinalis]